MISLSGFATDVYRWQAVGWSCARSCSPRSKLCIYPLPPAHPLSTLPPSKGQESMMPSTTQPASCCTIASLCQCACLCHSFTLTQFFLLSLGHMPPTVAVSRVVPSASEVEHCVSRWCQECKQVETSPAAGHPTAYNRTDSPWTTLYSAACHTLAQVASWQHSCCLPRSQYC